MADIFASGNLIPMIVVIVAIIASSVTTLILLPMVMKKMTERGITGVDWNKKDKKEIPELGGIAILFGFPIGVSIATGVFKLFGPGFLATPILAAISVLFIAGMIGLIDDLSDIPQRAKAIILAFAALPLIIAGTGLGVIDLPFNNQIDFTGSETLFLIFWILIVPIAVTGAANAMNMSAGYNGLESGQIAIISLCLLAVTITLNKPFEATIIFAALFGVAIGLNYFNGFPAVTFVGDVGTLSMGAVIGAGTIIGSVELAGLIAIAPAFFEAISTAYYSFIKKVNRKIACAAPIIDDDGKLHAPKGAERYTLGYWILSKKPMNERNLVRTILGIYLISGVIAILVSFL
jgi:UDP-N-acetylglucosamine--dolichyl-phosphate N-acetylglucosaminephosphotransferase